MTGLLALSTAATLALIGAGVVALAFIAGLIVLGLRRRGPQGPDIPPGMRPGPSDETLERTYGVRVMAWGVAFTVLIAPWLAAIWLGEPNQNVDDEIELIARSQDRGSQWFQVSSEENPTGFGCARCHGEEAQGGSVPYTTEDGEFIPAYPVPPLNNVCSRLPIEEEGGIRETIMQGRENTPMPSWSVQFEGPMNDQQIQDLIAYIVSIQEIPEGQPNLCLNPEAAAEGSAEESPAAGESPAAEESPESS